MGYRRTFVDGVTEMQNVCMTSHRIDTAVAAWLVTGVTVTAVMQSTVVCSMIVMKTHDVSPTERQTHTSVVATQDTKVITGEKRCSFLLLFSFITDNPR